MTKMPGPRRSLALLLLTGTLVAPHAPAGSRTRSEDGPTWVPLKGRIVVGRTWGHSGGHSFPAIDFEIAAGKSVPVYAAGPGTVIAAFGNCADTTSGGGHADCNGGQGNLVEIVHPDGRRSRYLHLRFHGADVVQGQYVCRGCPIGRTGWSGNVSPAGPGGAHLHYEELRGFRPVDPGPMRALHRGGRVAYPRGGAGWKQVGGDRLVIRNTGFPAPGPAPTASCQGWAATRSGTAGPDEIVGTAGPDIIDGAGGNDFIRGADGDDRICGGAGDDTLIGGANHDIVDGGEGTDTCFQDEPDGYHAEGEGTLVSCERPPYTLTVEVYCCLRVVTSTPPGISCPPDCSEPYPTQTNVALRVSAGSANWQGCDSVEGGICTVVMRFDRNVRG
jgi:hypothetical protein